jgi:TonB family protein
VADSAGVSPPIPRLVVPPRRPDWGRGDGRKRPRWLELAAFGSLYVHGMILAIILLARHVPPVPTPPPAEPGVEMVFEDGQKAAHAAPHPSRFIENPNGDATGPLGPAQAPATPPQQPPAPPAPEVNLLPPEMQAPQLPQVEHAEPMPAPSKSQQQRQARARAAREYNPFAHMNLPNFAAQGRHPVRGLQNSRSIDLSMGPVIEGGQLKDAVPHIASPGADGDYMELLSNYVETHKFYPEQAGRNGEQGTATIKAMITRDGTVKDVRLEESSEYRMLDVALMSMFRNKHLPPFPDDMKENEREFTISMTYEIVN